MHTETKTTYVRLADVKMNGSIRGTKEELALLIESMRSVGQIQEIVIRPNFEIVCGRRRVEAAKALGWSRIRANICTTEEEEVEAELKERDENTCRVGFTRQECLERGRRIENKLRPKAAQNQATNTGGKERKPAFGKLPKAEKIDVREAAAKAAEMSPRTFEKAQQVIASAQQHPDRYADLGQQVATDKQPIDPVYQEFKQRQEIYEAAEKDERFSSVAAKLTETHDTAKAAAEYERLRDEQGRDKVGTPLPKRLMRVFNRPWADEAAADIDRALEGVLNTAFRMVRKNGDDPYLPADTESAFESAISGLRSVRDVLMAIVPHAVCPKCKGAGCNKCKGSGWVTKEGYRRC